MKKLVLAIAAVIALGISVALIGNPASCSNLPPGGSPPPTVAQLEQIGFSSDQATDINTNSLSPQAANAKYPGIITGGDLDSSLHGRIKHVVRHAETWLRGALWGVPACCDSYHSEHGYCLCGCCQKNCYMSWWCLWVTLTSCSIN